MIGEFLLGQAIWAAALFAQEGVLSNESCPAEWKKSSKEYLQTALLSSTLRPHA